MRGDDQQQPSDREQRARDDRPELSPLRRIEDLGTTSQTPAIRMSRTHLGKTDGRMTRHRGDHLGAILGTTISDVSSERGGSRCGSRPRRLRLALDFFVYSRDAAGTAELRDDLELLEEHWSYMDRFADAMIARGPTLDGNRETATGSLHMLGLPSVDAAREFVALEPNNLRRRLRRAPRLAVREPAGTHDVGVPGSDGEPRFLVIGRLAAAIGRCQRRPSRRSCLNG